MPSAPASDLIDLAHAYGVSTEYQDWQGQHVDVSAHTITTVLGALGVDALSPEATRAARADVVDAPWRRTVPPFTLAREGVATQVAVHVPHGSQVRVEVVLEDGERRSLAQAQVWVDPRTVDGVLVGEATFVVPADLPLGYHELHARVGDAGSGEAEESAEAGDSASSGRLAVVPTRLELPTAVARSGAAGLMTQLYSVRSRRSWGVGDLADLADMTVWGARDLGADFVLINPVHAAEYAGPMEPSPYLPTSRRFVNPLYIRVEDVPEVAYLTPERRAEVERLAQRARALTEADRIDRNAAWPLKREALELVFAQPRSPRRQLAFDAFCEQEGQGLVDYATWCVLARLHVGEEWPDDLQDARSDAVAALREAHADGVRFVMWLQWVVDDQLGAVQREARSAGMSLGVMQDLAVGVHPRGADAWGLGSALARGVTVGAPPDAYNQLGQDWSQPPWRPDRLTDLGYEPFREMIQAALRHSGGLRIDHIIGLFRLWWVPAGHEAIDGTYVRLDHEALIGILVLEARRAGAVVVGEDLGTVEPWVREYLSGRGVLGTSILWFEREESGAPRRPEDYRSLCLVSVTTHDLPPTAGYLTGEHIAVREELGLFTRPVEVERADDERDRLSMLEALAERGMLGDDARACAAVADAEAHVDEVVEGLYRYVSATPSLLVGISVPDLVSDRRTMNQPGTSDEYPNWRLPLADEERRPVLLEDLIASRRARRLTRCVQRGE